MVSSLVTEPTRSISMVTTKWTSLVAKHLLSGGDHLLCRTNHECHTNWRLQVSFHRSAPKWLGGTVKPDMPILTTFDSTLWSAQAFSRRAHRERLAGSGATAFAYGLLAEHRERL